MSFNVLGGKSDWKCKRRGEQLQRKSKESLTLDTISICLNASRKFAGTWQLCFISLIIWWTAPIFTQGVGFAQYLPQQPGTVSTLSTDQVHSEFRPKLIHKSHGPVQQGMRRVSSQRSSRGFSLSKMSYLL